MPAKFDKCVAAGGKVRTIKPNATTYMKVCIPPGGHHSVGGETHKKKGK